MPEDIQRELTTRGEAGHRQPDRVGHTQCGSEGTDHFSARGIEWGTLRQSTVHTEGTDSQTDRGHSQWGTVHSSYRGHWQPATVGVGWRLGTYNQTHRVGHTGTLSTVHTEGTDNQSGRGYTTVQTEGTDNQSDRGHILGHTGAVNCT